MTEFGFIDSIRRLFADVDGNGFEAIGDDCTVAPIGGGQSLVLTCDMLTEGIHFLRDRTPPFELGRKSLAVNLSDVAAMGAAPVATLLALSLPPEATDAWAAEFMRGYHDLSLRYGVALAGGDTTASASGIVISVTAIGRAPSAHVKRRSAARTEDLILVGDVLGASGEGLRDLLAGNGDTEAACIHRNPEPQVEEGIWLGARKEVHAMMDLSDGLASDLPHMLAASGVGAELDIERIPAYADPKGAVCAGEDYKLLLTADSRGAERLQADFLKRFGKPLYPIGRITPEKGLRWLLAGVPQSLDWHGFTHY